MKFKGFLHTINSFCKDHEDTITSIFMVLLLLVFLSCSIYLFVSCKGTWKLENHTKVNGVHVDTQISYKDSEESIAVNTPEPEKENSEE